MDIKNHSMEQAKKNYSLIEDSMDIIDIKRVNSQNKIEGSSIYILLDADKEAFYGGETGASLYARIKGNGNASHCKKEWFDNVKYISYHDMPNDKFIRRKWENEVSLVLKPKYN